MDAATIAVAVALAAVAVYLFVVPLATTGILIVRSVQLWWYRHWFSSRFGGKR